MERQRWRIRVRGIVQGVGFRPFVYRLAHRFSFSGWVKNDDEGVLIELEGEPLFLRDFLTALEKEAPAVADIVAIEVEECAVAGETVFEIVRSEIKAEQETLIAPDIAVCDTCRSEILNRENRRFNYPFTNCTDCGPRYSIVSGAPYDRERTAMTEFKMCSSCSEEYSNPLDRRFHAQPNACEVCGPEICIEYSAGSEKSADNSRVKTTEEKYEEIRQIIKEGKIVAIKGIGGFHLAADATNEAAVRRLRQRKMRESKPFAVMAGSLERIKEFAELSVTEEQLLRSPAAPIVLLKKKNSFGDDGWQLAESVAPDNAYIGVMLPYTPLQVLLLKKDDVWIMTSGNATGEPQIFENNEAKVKLDKIADAFVMYNRKIINPTDDSLVRNCFGVSQTIRRGRGLAPAPLSVSEGAEILAAGAELKSAFCFVKDKKAFLSEHIGDLKNQETFSHYREKMQRYQELFALKPVAYAVDLHPDYLSTQYVSRLAKKQDAPLFKIQHHKAHIAAVMEENKVTDAVIGVAFDGTGYGDDGKIWGGEFFCGRMKNLVRKGHFSYLALPGGEASAREPWRQALWVLNQVYGKEIIERRPDFAGYYRNGGKLLIEGVNAGVNSPLSSSVGRLFDTAAAILGICYVNTYEGEAASALEQTALMTDKTELLPYEIKENNDNIEINLLPLLKALSERFTGDNAAVLARSFHVTLAAAASEVIRCLAQKTGVRKVALGGGVFQNVLLTSLLRKRLADFELLMNKDVPMNDGGIAYGQAAIVREILKEVDRDVPGSTGKNN